MSIFSRFQGNSHFRPKKTVGHPNPSAPFPAEVDPGKGSQVAEYAINLASRLSGLAGPGEILGISLDDNIQLR